MGCAVKGARGLSKYRRSFHLSSRHFRLNANSNTAVGFADGPEIINFSEKTLQWIVDTTESHVDQHSGKYSFEKDDVKLLSYEPVDGKALIACTAQNTSTWFINR